MCTTKGEIHAEIVLAGDTKQLGAVAKSDVGRELGYTVSWMEKLCEYKLYKKQPAGNFNMRYITQLVENYAKEGKIYHLYVNVIKSTSTRKKNDLFSLAEVIFKSVRGFCEQSVENSWCNEHEINEVLRTIKSLLPPDATENGLRRIEQTDIGVVTMYRKQQRQIVKHLRRFHFNDVCVGTAQIFQGKEKPIIIISTVRSNGSLGFVSDERVCFYS